MPYITVRENKAKWWITVQGLNYNEVGVGTVGCQVLGVRCGLWGVRWRVSVVECSDFDALLGEALVRETE